MVWPSDLPILDICDSLPRADWSIGTRQETTSITWHYNGPAVPPDRQCGLGLLAQLRADAAYQMRPGWGGTKNGADGLMYHLVVAADGMIYQTRALDAMLWHCAHQDGNSRGLAVHLPLGQGQWPSMSQLASLFRLTNALCAYYAIPIMQVLGHLEWRHMTACPGPAVMRYLTSYRAGLAPVIERPTVLPAGVRRWQISPDLALPARVRQAPATRRPDGSEVPIAGRLKPGTTVYVDVAVEGEAVDGLTQWVHMARVDHEQADLGFLSATLGTWVP